MWPRLRRALLTGEQRNVTILIFEARVKLPADTLIPREKATRYLLIPQARGDKSAFLERAGYTLVSAEQLLNDLRTQLLPMEAAPLQSNQFGQYYEIRGKLTGPNGRRLAVRTIWMREHLSGISKFVTLLPDKRTTE
jgi:hypothetical protein